MTMHRALQPQADIHRALDTIERRFRICNKKLQLENYWKLMQGAYLFGTAKMIRKVLDS